jgi:hypothetical protein
MRSRNFTENGQALIIIALAMIGLVAMVGLAIDGSAKFSDQRHAQNAADTAAMAAALAKVDTLLAAATNSSISTSPESCPPPSGLMSDASDVCVALMVAGLNRAISNGYDNITNNTIEIHSPPASGNYAGDKNYVQVIITSTINTTFARVIGRNQLTNIVEAVALAKPGRKLADGAMIISYDPDPNCSTGGTGGYSVSVSGSSTVNLNGGGIFLNSDEVCGFVIPNCADLNIYSGSINSVGNNIDTGACVFDPPLVPKINQDAVAIPDDVYWPDVPPECGMSGYPAPTKLGEVVVGNKTIEEWLIYPGYYTTFPQATLVANKSHIYMASGVYCIDPGGPSWNGDLSWSPVDAAILNGSTDPSRNKYHAYNPDGVTLYVKKGGGFDVNSNNPTYLDASTTGDYQGYLIILEGTRNSIEGCTITGGADLHINGLIFAPYCDITINGGSAPTAEINAQLVGWNIKINGTTTINFNYDPSNQVKIKRKVGLMK